MSTLIRGPVLLFLSIAISHCCIAIDSVVAEAPYQVVWGRQIGTPDHDLSHAVAVDTLGNLFLAWTYDSPPIGENSRYDTGVNKYDFDGNLQWTRSFDSVLSDLGYDIAADDLGNAYLTGVTTIASSAQNRAAHHDAFLKKVSPDGSTLWEHSFGTASGDEADSVFASPFGDVFVSGQTGGSLGAPNVGRNDAYVSKFDANGDQVWLKQFGTDLTEVAWAVSGDRLGNVFISGTTFGVIGDVAYGSADTFTIKLDSDGNTLWKRQWGSVSYDQSYAVQADGEGGAYIAGYGLGAFVARYDANGDLLWSTFMNSGQDDLATNLVLDDLGNVYVAGSTRGTLGDQSFGGIDVFLSKLTADGDVLWTTQFGSEADDGASGLAVDLNRDAYISGLTWGALAGPHLGGGGDAFLVKLSESYVPEPGYQALCFCALAGVASFRRRKVR